MVWTYIQKEAVWTYVQNGKVWLVIFGGVDVFWRVAKIRENDSDVFRRSPKVLLPKIFEIDGARNSMHLRPSGPGLDICPTRANLTATT
jgi:hypothetical protein